MSDSVPTIYRILMYSEALTECMELIEKRYHNRSQEVNYPAFDIEETYGKIEYICGREECKDDYVSKMLYKKLPTMEFLKRLSITKKIPCLVICINQSVDAIMMDLLSAICALDIHRLRTGIFRPCHFHRITKAGGAIYDRKSYFLVFSKPENIRRIQDVKRFVKEKFISFVLILYKQSNDKYVVANSNIINRRYLDLLAKYLSVPIGLSRIYLDLRNDVITQENEEDSVRPRQSNN